MTATLTGDRDYVLGTHDEEIARLGLQHRVWRPRTLDAWRRAGFTVGQTLLDVGCGPGYATLDLAEIVGPEGRVLAIDRSRRFLDVLEAHCRQRDLRQVETAEVDLDEAGPPAVGADGAWCRWILAFLRDPRELLVRIRQALKPGGVVVVHEYLDYGTWRVAPRSPEFEDFVQVVMASWRDSGGEPDVGLDLPRWLGELEFTTLSQQPIVDVVTPSNFVWQWPRAFLAVGLRRMTDLSRLTAERARAVWDRFLALEATPHALMVTPTVLEIIAAKR